MSQHRPDGLSPQTASQFEPQPPPGPILFNSETIARRIGEMGAQIDAHLYGVEGPALFVCVLRGAVVFLADLIRATCIPINIAFIGLSSYDGTESIGQLREIVRLDEEVSGRHVLIVEDIVDTGRTLAYLQEKLAARHPASLQTCVLLDKPSRRVMDVPVEWAGFEIPDRFVVGYGLDFEGRYRNLPYIAELKTT